MANSQGDKNGNPSTSPPRPLDPLAAVLSYLVPGLGQIYQGRVGKGVLFLICIYALFFYGTYLGTSTVTLQLHDRPVTYRLTGSVYLPDSAAANNPYHLPTLLANLVNRPQFLAQVWTGVVAWPAIWHYIHGDSKTVQVAGLDAVTAEEPVGGHWLFGDFGRAPRLEALNAVTTAGDKRIDLSWVFTVIAGVLNIMVIYDALAGPAFPAPARSSSTPVPAPAEAAA
jgi:hypothetical protein